MAETKDWIVEIIDLKTGLVERTLEYASESAAYRGERGVNINIDSERYRTEVSHKKAKANPTR